MNAEEERMLMGEPQEGGGGTLTSLGVWLSAILWPSNRNLSVLAATP